MSNWRNRIVGHEDVAPASLNLNPSNYRDHPEYQRAVMNGILDEIGWIQTVVVNKNTNNIIDGHLRVEIAIENGDETVPVTYVDLDEEEERKALITFNPVAQLARENKKKLEKTLQNLDIRNDNMVKLAELVAHKNKLEYTPPSRVGLLDEIGEDEGDEDDEDGEEKDPESNPMEDELQALVTKWDVVPGRVWKLGKHIIACGDCTDELLKKKVYGKLKINAVVTDPPYGIDAVGGDGRIGLAAKFGRIEGDMKPFDPAHLLGMSDEVVMWGANNFAGKLPISSHWLIWDKRVTNERRNDFADAEMAWCKSKGVVRVFRHLWMGYARESERGIKRYHPTQKPLMVIEWMLGEVSKRGDIIADPYVGSGTTLLACEKTGRTCLAFDIDKRYVAVTINRWVELTGKVPEVIA
jgi:DNA modification methylase